MLRIDMLAARHGDCLCIEYGDAADPHRILIDGGPAFAYEQLRNRLRQIPDRKRRLDLLVVTHIDADHIEGVIKLLGDSEMQFPIDDLWYNGYTQLTSAENFSFGALQGEYLSALIETRKLPWNRRFDGGPVVTAAGEADLPVIDLPGGCRLTLLSPTPVQTRNLRLRWDKELAEAGLEPDSTEEAMARLQGSRLRSDLSFDTKGPDVAALSAKPFKEDTTVANGSSIAFLLEYEGKRCLLAGDAHPGVLETAVARLLAKQGGDRLKLDAFKLPHHGSKHNLSPSLLKLLDCRQYLVSSDGGYFNHPDPEALARLVAHGGGDSRILFNYLTPRTSMWGDGDLMAKHGYVAAFPPEDKPGMVIEL